MKFSHLHNHTQFSLLDGASNIDKLFQKAKADEMPAVAITDHGNMFGVFDFVAKANKYGVKPVVGCEFYVVEDHTIKSFTKDKKDKRYHQLLLAKNATGYKNLTKLCSLGFMDGLYGKYPRVTKALIEQYMEGLIATTCCIGARVPQEILRNGDAAGKKEFEWWLERFGEDYYVEIQRHEIPDQIKVNNVLLEWAKEYNVKVIASNDSHYVDQEDSVAHDILLCVNTNEKMSTPKMKDYDDEGGGQGGRFAFYNDQFYFKTTAEMTHLFRDIPEAIDNTNEIVGKVENLELKKDIMLPNFPIPEEFKQHKDDTLNQWEYLQHLTYEGAKKRYGEIDDNVKERIDFELFTIRTMGFAGYFLIVMDFIKAGKDLGVMIGPGRGSAAGSAVAYCIGITNIDPIKYNLLFERFLNPDRKSMPDIDTDFDDEGRQKVIDYVVEKYGRNQVAQIITYGTMATKSSIKDVARVMELPLADANAIVKLVPDKPAYGINFQKLIHYPETGGGDKTLSKVGLQPEEIENVRKIRAMYHGHGLEAKVLKQAEKLEGTVRNTGIHAAGIIIAPSDLSDIVPVSTSKDSDLLITQYEGKIIEDAGVIKMDFLGLRNLTILKEALRMIKENHGVEIEIDEIPLDDAKTYELFQRGETNAIFQFESDGMKKHMKDLKPDRFDDLIAMNALYRPGPIAYIPNYIDRKHGREDITYDLPEMEEYLSESYGITVYQEQVMLLSQKLAGFTKGDADVLRKAMGKKQIEVLNKLKSKFIEGGTANGHPEETLNKVWKDWEAFAQYAFNKSHSTCYAFVAYQTAYLKSHYPSEYMAGVLTSQLGNIDKITFFMEECRNLGLPVLGPDVNESFRRFGVNKKGEIRFGLGGIKGSGDAAVEAIINERDANGKFKDIYDFITRVNLRTVNKKTLESLVYAGAFDCFEDIHRAQYFAPLKQGGNFIETLIRYANKLDDDKNSAQASLFGGGDGGDDNMINPQPMKVEPWGNLERLKYEKEVVGFYISGHPLDQFAIEMGICKPIENLIHIDNVDKEFSIGGMITAVQIRQSKNGKPFSIFKIEDYTGGIEIMLFGNDHIKFANYLMEGQFLYCRGVVRGRYNNLDQLEFSPKDMQLLSDLKEKRFKEMNVRLNLNQLNEKTVSELKIITQEHPGNFNMKIQVYDTEDALDLQLYSRNIKIDINKKVKEQLNELCGEGSVSFA